MRGDEAGFADRLRHRAVKVTMSPMLMGCKKSASSSPSGATADAPAKNRAA